MTERTSRGLLVICVDLETEVPLPATRQRRRAEAVSRQLFELLEHRRFPATWGIGDPSASDTTGPILESRLGHEVALLGDPSWVGRAAGRTQFARQLTDRVQRARDQQIGISTLVLRQVELNENLDLLVRNKISVVRTATVESGGSADSLRPQSPRFGLWQASPCLTLPGRYRWWAGGPSFVARRMLDRAIAQRELMLLLVDGPQLADSSQFSTLQRLLGYAHRRREQGLLAVKTLGHVATRLSRLPEPRRGGSILRPAA